MLQSELLDGDIENEDFLKESFCKIIVNIFVDYPEALEECVWIIP